VGVGDQGSGVREQGAGDRGKMVHELVGSVKVMRD